MWDAEACGASRAGGGVMGETAATITVITLHGLTVERARELAWCLNERGFDVERELLGMKGHMPHARATGHAVMMMRPGPPEPGAV